MAKVRLRFERQNKSPGLIGIRKREEPEQKTDSIIRGLWRLS
jgi:hypothetical protein